MRCDCPARDRNLRAEDRHADRLLRGSQRFPGAVQIGPSPVLQRAILLIRLGRRRHLVGRCLIDQSHLTLQPAAAITDEVAQRPFHVIAKPSAVGIKPAEIAANEAPGKLLDQRLDWGESGTLGNPMPGSRP